jgi:hypothetical protein
MGQRSHTGYKVSCWSVTYLTHMTYLTNFTFV